MKSFKFNNNFQRLQFLEILKTLSIALSCLINTGSLAKAYPPDHIKKDVIEIDQNENWDFRTEKCCEEGKYNLLSVAIHEIGHAIGLGESSNKDAVMYFRYRPLRDLSSDDNYAIQQLYGTKRENRWAAVSPEYADMIARYKIMQQCQLEPPRKQNYFQSSKFSIYQINYYLTFIKQTLEDTFF